MKIIFTDDALEDLASIRAYLGARSPAAADRMGRRLVEACDTLVIFPRRGKPGQLSGTRENATVAPYVIVYRILPAEVQILRVWHEAQSRSNA